jgi:hypothetical protein
MDEIILSDFLVAHHKVIGLLHAMNFTVHIGQLFADLFGPVTSMLIVCRSTYHFACHSLTAWPLSQPVLKV